MGTVTPPAIHTQTHTRDTQALTLTLLINSADKDWLAPETPLSVCFSLCCDSQEIDEHTNKLSPPLAAHTHRNTQAAPGDVPVSQSIAGVSTLYCLALAVSHAGNG